MTVSHGRKSMNRSLYLALYCRLDPYKNQGNHYYVPLHGAFSNKKAPRLTFCIINAFNNKNYALERNAITGVDILLAACIRQNKSIGFVTCHHISGPGGPFMFDIIGPAGPLMYSDQIFRDRPP